MSTISWVQDPALGTQLAAFNAFSILGAIFLTLIVATAYFSTTVHRSELWYRHIIAWIVYDAAFFFLIGNQEATVPPFGLCIFQASLIYAVPTFPTLSAFCFVADLYIRLSSIVHKKRKIRPALHKLLVHVPIFVLLSVFIEVLVLVRDPSVVGFEESHLYCHVTTSAQSLISGAIIIATGLLIFPLEIWVSIVLYRNWRSFRGSKEHTMFLTMFIRVVLFTIMSMLGVGLSSLSIGSPSAPKPYWTRLILVFVPIIAGLTFGSQEDIMRSWIFWREPVQPVTPPQDTETSAGADTGMMV